jgi:hypothetical protein
MLSLGLAIRIQTESIPSDKRHGFNREIYHDGLHFYHGAREPEVFLHHRPFCQLKSTRKTGTKGEQSKLDDITGSGQAWLIQLWT